MTDTLLVTGGGGFVLSHLVRQWLEADESHQALVVDASPLDAMAQEWFSAVSDRMTFLQGSVTDPSLWAQIDPKRITHMVHAAAVTSINRLFKQGVSGGEGALETNLIGTVHALAFAGRCDGLKRLIHVSTGSVYGTTGPEDPTQPLPEDGYVDPDGFYGITKYAGEQMALQAARQFGLPATIVRLTSIYGPMDRETAHRAVALPPAVLMHRALAGEAVKVTDLGGGFDCLHAGDVASGIRALLGAEALSYPVYNIAYGTRYTMGDLVDAVAAVVPGFAAEIVPQEEADIVVDPTKDQGRWNAYDISRMKADTAWRPRPFIEALEDYRDWLLAQKG